MVLFFALLESKFRPKIITLFSYLKVSCGLFLVQPWFWCSWPNCTFKIFHILISFLINPFHMWYHSLLLDLMYLCDLWKDTELLDLMPKVSFAEGKPDILYFQTKSICFVKGWIKRKKRKGTHGEKCVNYVSHKR